MDCLPRIIPRPDAFALSPGECFPGFAQPTAGNSWPEVARSALAVWVGAATHDIGFEKDQRNGKVTREIDPAVAGGARHHQPDPARAGQTKETLPTICFLLRGRMPKTSPEADALGRTNYGHVPAKMDGCGPAERWRLAPRCRHANRAASPRFRFPRRGPGNRLHLNPPQPALHPLS